MTLADLTRFLHLNDFEVSAPQPADLEIDIPEHVYATDPKTSSTLLFTTEHTPSTVLAKIDQSRASFARKETS